MKKIVFYLGALYFLSSCEKSEFFKMQGLEGQWILDNVSCFCYFENSEFNSNQLWFFQEKGVLLSKGSGSNYYGISTLNLPESYFLEKGILKIPSSKRTYNLSLEEDVLTLTYIDNPEIADDEISYRFVRGNAPSTCIDPDQIKLAMCTKEYMPVCGCDGYTYGNACEASVNGVMQVTEGTCK